MKLRTSFFNTAVLKKNVTRFAPLWGLYTVFMLLCLFVIWENQESVGEFARSVAQAAQAMSVPNFLYAGLCTLLLFGDLFTSKMAGMLHAMPMRREGWFLTHLASGMLFCLVPNTLLAVIGCALLQEFWYLALLWLLVTVLQFVVFFGIGAFSAQCAGTKLGATVVYLLVNFMAVLVGFLVEIFYEPLLYGVDINVEQVFKGAPVVGFASSEYMKVQYDYATNGARFEGLNAANWQYLLVAFAVGIAFLALAVVLYRRRRLECAGDFIAFRPAAPAFLILYTLCVGAILYLFAEVLETDARYFFMVTGFAIGIFTGHMLLEKKVKVFQWRKWVNFGVLTVAFFLTIGVAKLDPFGITRYVPQVSQVENVCVSPYFANDFGEDYITLTDDQEIQMIVDMHKVLTGNRESVDSKPSDNITLTLEYHLKNGRKVTRSYEVPVNSREAQQAKVLFGDFRYVTGADSVDSLLETLQTLEFYGEKSGVANISFLANSFDGVTRDEYWITINFADQMSKSEVVRGLIEAIEADCLEGNMVQLWEFHNGQEHFGSIEFGCLGDRQYRYKHITVYDNCEHTIRYLKDLVAAYEVDLSADASAEDVAAGNVPETTATESAMVGVS